MKATRQRIGATRARRISRRALLMSSCAAALGYGGWLAVASRPASSTPLVAQDPRSAVFQATGTRVGEVTPTSAIIWTRATSVATRQPAGRVSISAIAIDELEGACPGTAGHIWVRYAREDKVRQGGEADDWAFLPGSSVTEIATVDCADDFIHQFALRDLTPDTTYYYESLACAADIDASLAGSEVNRFRGRFRTALEVNQPSELTFTVMTCQCFRHCDHPDGHSIYPSMQALNPRFACLTGDLVYYDVDKPLVTSPSEASYHWQRMFSLPRLIEFNRNAATYWLKDDHDTLKNESEPGTKLGELSFAEVRRSFAGKLPCIRDPVTARFVGARICRSGCPRAAIIALRTPCRTAPPKLYGVRNSGNGSCEPWPRATPGGRC